MVASRSASKCKGKSEKREVRREHRGLKVWLFPHFSLLTPLFLPSLSPHFSRVSSFVLFPLFLFSLFPLLAMLSGFNNHIKLRRGPLKSSMLWEHCAVVLAAIFCTSVAHADSLSDVKSRGELIWGGDKEGGGPYIFKNPENLQEMLGYDLLFAEALAKKLGVKPKFFQGAWEKMPAFLLSNNIDIITNGYEWDPDRVKEMEASIPYYVYGVQMMVRQDEKRIVKWEDLKKLNDGKKWKAGVLSDSAGQFYLEKTFPDTVQIVGYDDNTVAMKDVLGGTLDLTAADTPILRYYAKREPFKEGLRLQGEVEGRGHYVVYARKGETELIKKINEAIVEMVDTGEIADVYSPYDMWDPSTELELRCTVRAASKLAIKSDFDYGVIAEICDPTAKPKSLSQLTTMPEAEGLLVSMTKDSTKKTDIETAPPPTSGPNEMVANLEKEATRLEGLAGEAQAKAEKAKGTKDEAKAKGAAYDALKLATDARAAATKARDDAAAATVAAAAAAAAAKPVDKTAVGNAVHGFGVVTTYGWVMIIAAFNTIILSLISFPLAIMIGLIVALVRMYGPKYLSYPFAGYVEFIRGTPLMLQLYIVYFFGVPILVTLTGGINSPLTGDFLGLQLSAWVASIISLSINYGAYESEIYRAGLQAIPIGQMEAALTIGMTKGQALRRIIVPQALRITIPPTVNDFIALFKDTSVCSVIGIIELTKEYSIDSKDNPQAFLAFAALASFLYLLMSYPLAVISRKIEKKLEREGAV
jgi:His/Glu/Gln/Arg/opine family amino acid ABC transporter permease subunit